jgi:epsin
MFFFFVFSGTISPNPFDMSGLEDSMNGGLGNTGIGVKRSPQSFLGENSALVNLDNLVTKPLPPPPHLAAAVPPPLPTSELALLKQKHFVIKFHTLQTTFVVK